MPGGSNKNNYANVDVIVDIAVREGVDAVWPGWGHASENPKLPNTLKSLGIKFIGPTGPVMYVLGDKIAANILAQTAKVPSIPWSGSFGGPNDGPLVAELNAEGTIPDEIFRKAQVTTIEEALVASRRIGFPVMLKASEGGGGKGIRMSDDEDQLRSAPCLPPHTHTPVGRKAGRAVIERRPLLTARGRRGQGPLAGFEGALSKAQAGRSMPG